MAAPIFPVSREADLVIWTTNFDARVLAGPLPLGITVLQSTQYHTLSDNFIAAYNLANNDGTRTRATVAAKDASKTLLLANARMLIRLVQATPTVSDATRLALGIPVRNTSPTPVPVPGDSPDIIVDSVNGRVVRIRLIDPAHPTHRARPAGVAGVTVLSYVGATPPEDPSGWDLEGSITKTQMDIAFPVTVAPGSKVWLSAFWYNPRAEAGPASAPVSTYTQFGGEMPMAA